MPDWNTVRYDPNYPEKIDTEIVPLCDALNAAGFPTDSSCCGHGSDWPRVWFALMPDERIERLARSLMRAEVSDQRPHFTVFRRKVLLDGYEWGMETHLTDTFCDTPREEYLGKTIAALEYITAHVRSWIG